MNYTFLHTSSCSLLKAIELRDRKPIFPILEHPELFDTEEIFHLINVDKFVRKNLSKGVTVRKCLGDYYERYRDALSKYKEALPQYNRYLLQKFINNNLNQKFDAVIYPSSNSHWRREGLVESFCEYFEVNGYEGIKNMDIEASQCNGELPEGFLFQFNAEVRFYQRFIILDDCYSSGSTVKTIVSSLGEQNYYSLACYYKDKKENQPSLSQDIAEILQNINNQ